MRARHAVVGVLRTWCVCVLSTRRGDNNFVFFNIHYVLKRKKKNSFARDYDLKKTPACRRPVRVSALSAIRIRFACGRRDRIASSTCPRAIEKTFSLFSTF